MTYVRKMAERVIDAVIDADTWDFTDSQLETVEAVINEVITDAADALKARAEKLYAFMETCAIGDERRPRISRRAAEWFEAEKVVRSLATTDKP